MGNTCCAANNTIGEPRNDSTTVPPPHTTPYADNEQEDYQHEETNNNNRHHSEHKVKNAANANEVDQDNEALVAAAAAAQVEQKLMEQIIEDQENQQQVTEYQFNRQLENLKNALAHSESLLVIPEQARKLSVAISQLEVIIQILNENSSNPAYLRDFKTDILGLYGDMQMFRSFHLRYTLDQSFFELAAIEDAVNLFRDAYSTISKDGKVNIVEFSQAFESGVYNVSFEVLKQRLSDIRATYNTLQGQNLSTLPNYMYVTLGKQPGFSLWEQLFPTDVETTNEIFSERYAEHCGAEKEDILNIIQLLDTAKDRRVDIYQWIDFVKQFSDAVDADGRIYVDRIPSFSSTIQAHARKAQQSPIKQEDGSYLLPSGAIYEGDLNDQFQKTGLGSIKDSDYEFYGHFVDDLPEGEGKEVRKHVQYTGNFERGLYHGEGVLKFPNGRKYTGTFQTHKFHGIGELINDDGVKYSGEWRNNALEFGQVTYPDGTIYVGQLKKNMFKQGQGSYSVIRQSFFLNSQADAQTVIYIEGSWNGDAPYEGKAYSYSENLIYQGEFSNWTYNGLGKRFYVDGTYEGELIRDKRNGTGLMSYKNGDQFTGQWLEDNQVSGTHYFGNDKKQKYEGDWVNGVMEGNGTFTYSSGGEYVGQIKQGKRHGYGTYRYNNNNVYAGQWIENNQEGEGIFQYASEGNQEGDIYKGQFVKGKYHGFGHYYYKKAGRHYIGYWQNDRWNGEGKFIRDDNTVIKAGVWQNDKIVSSKDVSQIVFPDEVKHMIMQGR